MIDLIKLFSKGEQIAGISITDKDVRLVLLGSDLKQGGKVAVRVALKEPLPAGTVVDGVLKEPAKLIEAVKTARDRTTYNLTYAILTLPKRLTYSRIFKFPKNITGEKLDETMRVNVGFNLPVSINDVYLDWERVASEQNELLLETIPRKVVDAYTKALEKAGVRIIALESQASSSMRALDFGGANPALLVAEDENKTSFTIVKDGTPRFYRFIPENLDEKKLSLEIRRLSDFYEAEDMAIEKIIEIEKAQMPAKFRGYQEFIENGIEWTPALGAAMRGLLPRGGDRLISLLPIGTEKAYEYQKSIVFTKFIGDLVTGIAIFFILAFVGALALVNTLAGRLDTQLAGLASIPLPQNAVEMENMAVKFNNITAMVSEIDKQSPRWTKFFEELEARTIAGITFANINITSPTNPISISGVSATRETVNNFRRSMEESAMFTEIRLPLTNLELRENIPFSITFRITDATALYPN